METDSKSSFVDPGNLLLVSDAKVGNIYIHSRRPKDLYLLLKKEAVDPYVSLTFLNLSNEEIWIVHYRPSWSLELDTVVEGEPG
jgi:hypothetical protein